VEFRIHNAIEVLERTPTVVAHLLRGLSPEWLAANEGRGTWSPSDVVGHLIHCEDADWIPRAEIILRDGESRPFDPFDRFAHLTRFRGWSLDDLLRRFAEARAANLETLRGWRLTPAQLARRGRHPDFGPVTLGELLATWVVHDLNHIAQIARVMAKQYGDAAGPWKAYLPILVR
jgi:uncharacterized damage-inducible protein DinB